MVICSWAVYFNSHPHKETNHNRRLLLNSYSGISIHVSLRRRTFTERKNNNYTGISTHVSARRRTGSLYHVSARRRTDGLLLVVSNKVFQFTSPYGDERQRRLKILTRLVYFNSRLLTETNFLFLWQMQVAQIFQFTSPYGDEPAKGLGIVLEELFQFTSPYGDERLSLFSEFSFSYFNSRLLTETNSEKNQYA